MCKYLDPACFMANVFASCPDKSSISFVTLRNVRDYVSNSLADQNVVIEWTRDSVMSALECYPDLFAEKDREVAWCGAEDGESIKRIFDAEFSDDFVDDLWRAIREEIEQNQVA